MEQVPSSIFILESPGVGDATIGRSEGPTLQELLRLLETPVLYRAVFDRRELETAAALFARGGFRFLHVSAHGCSTGIELSDGELVEWDDFFDLFGLPPQATVSFSSCEVLAGDRLLNVCTELDNPPFQVFGYEDQVSWQDAALATAMLMQHRARVSGKDLAREQIALMSSVWLALRVNIHSAVLPAGGSSYFRVSGHAALEALIDTARGKKINDVFDEILDSRQIKENKEDELVVTRVDSKHGDLVS